MLARLVVPAPPHQRRAGDRRADHRPHRDAAEEPLRSFRVPSQELGEVPEAAERATARWTATGRVAARRPPQPAFRDWGASVARIATIPMPTQAISDAASSEKSPIARSVMPSRPAIAAPAHAPSDAAR